MSRSHKDGKGGHRTSALHYLEPYIFNGKLYDSCWSRDENVGDTKYVKRVASRARRREAKKLLDSAYAEFCEDLAELQQELMSYDLYYDDYGDWDEFSYIEPDERDETDHYADEYYPDYDWEY